MAYKLLGIVLLCCLAAITRATPSREETALRRAITSRRAATYVLTKDIFLSADLPPLANKKKLTVRSPDPSRQYRIDGRKKYRLFRTTPGGIVDLTLLNLNLTRARTEAVSLGKGSKLSVETVAFVKNVRGLTLDKVNARIVHSEFVGHSKSAIVAQSDKTPGVILDLFMVRFSENNSQKKAGGGAIRVRSYVSATCDKCTFENNSASTVGGAVSFFDTPEARIWRSGFYTNRAKQSGGAVSLYNTAAQFLDTSFEGNVAVRREGGAVQVASDGMGASTYFQNVYFNNNRALRKGGGAFVLGGYSRARFCTVSDEAITGNVGFGGRPNNGVYIGDNNFLTTEPGVEIPLVSGSFDSEITFERARCP